MIGLQYSINYLCFRQSIENGSFAAKYFAAKSVPVEDLSVIFPKRQNKNGTFIKGFKEKPYSFLDTSVTKNNQEGNL